MAMLQCDICGGKLKGRPGGIYECEFCGIEYDTAWAKEKIQEIRGIVQVEGTVEVRGTVKVEGGANVSSLLKRAWLSIEDKQFDTAKSCFEQILNIEPELGEAHFGLGMATARFTTPENYAQNYRLVNQPHLARARKCTDAKCLELLARYDAEADRLEEKRKQEALEYEQQQKHQQQMREKAELAAQAQAQAFLNLTNKMRGKIAVTNTGALSIRTDGTVQCVGKNDFDQLNVEQWDNIIAIAGHDDHTIGLRADGTVLAAGNNKTGCCDVTNWRNITKVATGSAHTVGLSKDGRVLSTTPKGFLNRMGQDQVSGWQNIVDIAATDGFTAGVRKDGQLLYCGHSGVFFDGFIQKSRHNYVAVDAGYNSFIALRNNGKVLGCNRISQKGLDTSEWRDVVQVSAGYDHVVGLRKDGTVIAAGETQDGACNVAKWKDVVAICADFRCTMGLKRDGTILQAGLQLRAASNWRLFQDASTFDQETAAAKAKLAEKKAEAQRIAKERRQAGLCQHCGGALKGLFSKACVSCGKLKDY